MVRGVWRVAPFLAVVLASCDELPYEIDRFPVPIDPSATVPVLRAAPGDESPVPVVIDSGAPLTILDGAETTRTRAALTLYGHTVGEAIPRARFLSTPILRRPVSGIGPEVGGVPVTPIAGTLGGDVLSLLAIRIDLAGGEVRFFTDVATDEDRFYEEGHAVIRSGPSGGGAFELEGGVVEYPASRLVVPVCLEQRFVGHSLVPREDALLVLATGFDRLVLTASAYTRARRTLDPTYDPDFQFVSPYHVPGSAEPVMVHLDQLERIALADDEHRSRGGCDELWLNRRMQEGGCDPALRCPCPDDKLRCNAGSTVELAGTLEVAVIPDDDPLLLAVRDELRPGFADIDGFLGAGVLRSTIFDLDYPHSRIIVRCQTDACRTNPRIPEPN